MLCYPLSIPSSKLTPTAECATCPTALCCAECRPRKASTRRCSSKPTAAPCNFRATDDCSVVFRYCPEIDIALVPGEERNLKLTYPEDLTVLAHYLTQPLP